MFRSVNDISSLSPNDLKSIQSTNFFKSTDKEVSHINILNNIKYNLNIVSKLIKAEFDKK